MAHYNEDGEIECTCFECIYGPQPLLKPTIELLDQKNLCTHPENIVNIPYSAARISINCGLVELRDDVEVEEYNDEDE